MPWTCPACQNAIQHSEIESAPRPGITYRCLVCRLELVMDPRRGKMTLAPNRAGEREAPPAIMGAEGYRDPSTADDRRRRW
jgi:hypothetical protein